MLLLLVQGLHDVAEGAEARIDVGRFPQSRPSHAGDLDALASGKINWYVVRDGKNRQIVDATRNLRKKKLCKTHLPAQNISEVICLQKSGRIFKGDVTMKPRFQMVKVKGAAVNLNKSMPD